MAAGPHAARRSRLGAAPHASGFNFDRRGHIKAMSALRVGFIALSASIPMLGAAASSSPPTHAFPQTQLAAPEPPAGEGAFVPGGALDTDCGHVGPDGDGYQFIATCAGKAVSPEGRWAVVTEAGEEGSAKLQNRHGRVEDELTALSDAMPFVLFWSPRPGWFFVNHYVGSDQDRLRVFEIVNGTAVERSSVFASAIKVAISRYPCLAREASMAASGWRWSRGGRRIAMIVYTAPAACHVEGPPGEWHPKGDWEPLWMIGDVETGRIDPASVRVRHNGVGPMPTDGPYARL
ncbi:MAG: hypothetical protein ACJ8ER_17790 [Allosphingosinicella sp.]